MNSIGFDSLKDRDYKGSASSGSASVSDDDMAMFSQLLDQKTNGKDTKETSKEAIYSDKEAKKENAEKAKTASDMPGKTKMSASKEMLYSFAYANKAALSLNQKSMMGLNADGMSKAAFMHANPNAGLAKTSDMPDKNIQLKGTAAAALKTDDSSKIQKDSQTGKAMSANANASAVNQEQQNQVALKGTDKAEKADAARNIKREEVIKQIIDHVELKNFAGKSELTIKMNPEFLGSMKMRLMFEGDKVSAEFNTTSQDVREALQESKDELSQAFAEKGMKVGKINVKLVDSVA